MPWVFQPLSSSHSLPPPASVLLEHRTLSLQRKKHTLSCPTSALSRTLMSKLLHMDSLAWRIVLEALHPITIPLSRKHAISLVETSTSQRSCSFVKPICHIKEISYTTACRLSCCYSYYLVFQVSKWQIQKNCLFAWNFDFMLYAFVAVLELSYLLRHSPTTLIFPSVALGAK